jgi:alkylation response protein AidB-like acyl-CoA dehydrogenase
MRFAFADDQEELRRTTRRVLDGHGGLASARALAGDVGDGPGFDAALWRKLGAELGLAGLVIPEHLGGAGLGWVELVGVAEELGRGLAAVPFLSTVCLGTTAILVAGDDAQQARLLPAIARGDTTAALAYVDAGTATTARADGDHVILTGRKRQVVDGHSAGVLIVTARDAAGVALYAIPGDAPGVTRRRLPTMDATRPLAELSLEGVRLPASARLARAGDGVLDRVLALACIGLAAEQVGGAQRCLDLSVEYAKVRTQFGRPIGAFQAIQHKCADLFLLVESARSAAYYAGWAASQPDIAADEVAAAASIAKAYCSDAYFQCAAETIQIHGGIGFTWEHDAHLYFKRARSSRDLLGAPAEHRERLAAGPVGLGGL